MVGGVDTVASSGPNPPTRNVVLARLSGTRSWAATYSSGMPWLIFPRPTRGDYLTVGQGLDPVHGGNGGDIAEIVENASMATIIGPYTNTGAVLGADKITLWLIGATSGFAALNPWSTAKTDLGTGGPFIIGARDDGTSVGPWLPTVTGSGTEGVSFVTVALDFGGDLIVQAASGGVAATLNGKEIVGTQDKGSIFKIKASTGDVVWKMGLSSARRPMAIAPDGSIVVLSPGTGTYGFTAYSDADGSIVGTFTGSGTVTSDLNPVRAIVAGAGRLYLLGTVTGAADFNPRSG